MVKRNAAKGVSSNVSSAANPAASAATHTTNQSSILRSSFAPSVFQLSLFASVIRGFDSQHLRIHDTATGRLRCEHALSSKADITCLDWGFHSHGQQDKHHQQSKKKRKRNEITNGVQSNGGPDNVLVAFGTSDSDVHLYAPLEARIVGRLQVGHQKGIYDFKFAKHGPQAEGWSLGGDGRLIQWDLEKKSIVR